MRSLKGDSEENVALASVLLPAALFPIAWYQHIVRASELNHLEQGSQSAPVGTVTKGNSIGQTQEFLLFVDQAKNLVTLKLLMPYHLQ